MLGYKFNMLISSIGKDAALSRRKDEFDSRSEYHINGSIANVGLRAALIKP